ncbi:KUP/HAK/KT family potassium transporter [Pseudolactococcus plantarum]|uniref:Probable potassium transport system protein Kup n=1 Tax=Pseudolactococcus plantarum TaxID=1365 RepID=A0A2A5S1R7_9LACT|nr:KUP/HAK/KT family potassium transporter [Lactococcus plantarum]PCS07398.1 potassium transporter Kup [Lactococcus plantarum]HCN75185.1 potassium transporter Kup [Lactococcus sp.]
MKQSKKWSSAGLLIAMGIVYGDIGTSPLYVMKGLIEGNHGRVNESFLIGSISLIFWTITLLTTVKYVMIALQADNNGEGGIFSLYTLVRPIGKFLVVPAIIGGAALLADGVLTPAVTVTSAVEGLRTLPIFTELFGYSQDVIVIITLVILLILFSFQRFGTDTVGKLFGPIMFMWFTFLLLSGFANMLQDLSVLRALNPIYGLKLLASPDNHLGLFILGNVFLATTGAEALYSDLGHVGKANIHLSWPYVKLSLIVNYFGQVAYLLKTDIRQFPEMNPFFQMIANPLMPLAIVFATLAAIIASQALITGSFTLVSEAMRLKILPRLHVLYPGTTRNQQYIPVVNFILWIATSIVVLVFQSSTKMEAAYGLSITVTMLMTTFLLHYYLRQKKYNPLFSMGVPLFFTVIEVIFLLSSLVKFIHGGYVAVILALLIIAIMYIWYKGSQITDGLVEHLSLRQYLPQLDRLRHDISFPLLQTNVVYLSKYMAEDEIDAPILYSILDKNPKRAHVYWFVNVSVTDEPFTKEYEVDTLGTDYVVMVKLYLGFRISQEVNVFLRQIVSDLMSSGEIEKQVQIYSVSENREVGDFRFVMLNEELSHSAQISAWSKFIMQTKFAIRQITVTPAKWFGLQFSEVLVERTPLVIGDCRRVPIKRLDVTEIDA